MAAPVQTQNQPIEASKSSFWAVTLLVSGTCIGGGMLALPIQTAHSGFALSFLAVLIAWAFMTFTGLLLVEATLWVKNETHFSSLSRILVGNGAKILAIVVYLFMNYTSLVAYTAGGAALITLWVKSLTGLAISYEMACLLFTLFFGSFIYLGTVVVGKINFIFMVGLVVTYLMLVSFGVGHLNLSYLAFKPAFRESVSIFSIILATFSYQMVVPSLCSQLNYNTNDLKKAIVFGTSIPLIVYSFWLLVIHGIVPLNGTNGLAAALEKGASVTEPLRMHITNPYFSLIADFFGLFAIVTSYLGLSLALFYFLKDCFKEFNIHMSKNSIILTSIIPTLLLAMMFPKALINCLDISGGYGDTILSGLLPITMIWIGRYRMNMKSDYCVPGGKISLVVAAAFYLGVMISQWL